MDKDNSIDQRLARIEDAIEALRQEMQQQAMQLRRNHGLIVEFIDIVSKAEETEGASEAPLLEALTARIEHLTSVCDKSAATAERISQFLHALETPGPLKAPARKVTNAGDARPGRAIKER